MPDSQITDLIERVKGKLNDPILMDWAITRYWNIEHGSSQLRKSTEQAWFDDLTLGRWLDSDNEAIITRLFVHLPAEKFINLGHAIGERWGNWSGNLAFHSAPVLARYQPDVACKLFTEPRGGRHPDVETVLGVIRSLSFLPRDEGVQLLRAIAQQVLNTSKEGFAQGLLFTELLSASWTLDRAVARDAIEAHLEAISGEREWKSLLDQVTLGLYGHSVYRQLASDIRYGQTQQGFQQLEIFFTEDAPLERLDRFSKETANLDDLIDLANRWLDQKDRDVVHPIAEKMRSNRSTKYRECLADFLIGVVAATCENQEIDTVNMGLRDITDCLASDLAEPRFFEQLFSSLKAFETKDVTTSLVNTLARERDTYGGVWVAQAMGRLGWDSFVAPLADAMCEDCGDFLCEAANTALIRIGQPARDYLIQNWDTLDSSQQIYGLSVIEVLGGGSAASFAVDRHDELLEEYPENWCHLALSAPEQRLLELLEQQLPRRQRMFDETFYVLAHLLDVTHPELDSIAERIKKSKVEQRKRRLAFERGDWFHNTLTLELKCPECGDTNEYRVKKVVVNPHGKGADSLLADEFPCASCKQWVDFEFTSGAHLAITAELMKMTSAKNEQGTAHSKVVITADVPYHGRRMSVVEVVTRCKGAVAENPGSIADWLRLGLCFQHVLSRPRCGLGYVEKALSLESHAVEAVFQKAEALVFQGSIEDAYQLLDQALEAKDRWRFFLTDVTSPAQFAARFARLYNQLLGRLGEFDRPRLHAAFLGTSKKVGRNDPCPCGSGKKYKKCCLAKH